MRPEVGMRPNAWTGVSVAIATFVAGLSAQSPRATQSSTITVVGCLERRTDSGTLAGTAVGTSATPETAGARANSSEPAPGFALTDATPARGSADAGKAANTTAGTSGTTAPGSPSAKSAQESR